MANVRPKSQIEVDKFLKEVMPKQIGFALKLTANELAFRIRKDTIDAMKTVFHKPTPWTLRSIVVERTDRRDGTSAWVGLKHAGIRNEVKTAQRNREYPSLASGSGVFYDNYETYALSHQFRGGFRKQKPWENRLIQAGFMPKGYFAVETDFVKKNAYDNPSPGLFNQLLSYFKINFSKSTKESAKRMRGRIARQYGLPEVDFRISLGPYAKGTEKTRQGRYLANLPMGIWMLEGAPGLKQTAVPLFLFVPKRGYRKRVFMENIAAKIIKRDYQAIFNDKLTYALRTAKY